MLFFFFFPHSLINSPENPPLCHGGDDTPRAFSLCNQWSALCCGPLAEGAVGLAAASRLLRPLIVGLHVVHITPWFKTYVLLGDCKKQEDNSSWDPFEFCSGTLPEF